MVATIPLSELVVDKMRYNLKSQYLCYYNIK